MKACSKEASRFFFGFSTDSLTLVLSLSLLASPVSNFLELSVLVFCELRVAFSKVRAKFLVGVLVSGFFGSSFFS
jgi:hypothetical protein